MRADDFTVFIIDDDAAVRDALALLLSMRDYRTAVFETAEDFLTAYQLGWNGCLLIDIRMPGIDGLTLLKRLHDLGCRIPAIIVTAHGDVGAAREAFRAHAIDFLEKPVDQVKLLAAIGEAAARQSASRRVRDERTNFETRTTRLTSRERQVMDLVVAGRHNREIADKLGISVRTVEVHKGRMMDKLGVENLVQLLRQSLQRDDTTE